MSRVAAALVVLAGAAVLAPAGCRRATFSDPGPGTPVVKALPLVAPRFSDVATMSGIRFRHFNSATPRRYMVETFGAGTAFLDYDGDGWLDVLLLNGTPLPGVKTTARPHMALYHNNHDGTFTDVTQKAGLADTTMYAMGVAAADYDNDGLPDIYISCALGPGHLFHNERGRFREVTAEAGVGNAGQWGTSCAWLDYDRDGRLDLFVCNYVQYASLADDQPCRAGDRYVYCIPTAYRATHCVLYHNEGNGRFRDVSEQTGIARSLGKSLGVAVWDYDGDGWPDIFVANDTEPSFLFHNDGHGHFTEVGVPSGVGMNEDGVAHSGMGIDLADTRNDGRCALVITNFSGQETSYYEQSEPHAGTFTDRRSVAGLATVTHNLLGFGILFFDYDNNGWQDIVQVNGHVQDEIEQREPAVKYREPAIVFSNRGDGTFVESTGGAPPAGTPMVARACARGDYDNDGRVDVLIAENGGPAHLWHNDTATSNHWLTLKLRGTRSNRDGIGAAVQVEAGGITQRTQVRSGSSYLSQSDLRAHFGLGDAKKATVRIDWPSGTADRLALSAVDQIVDVVEESTKAR